MNDLLIGSLHARILFESTWVWVVIICASYEWDTTSVPLSSSKKNFTRLEVLLDNLWAEFEQIKVNLVDFT